MLSTLSHEVEKKRKIYDHCIDIENSPRRYVSGVISYRHVMSSLENSPLKMPPAHMPLVAPDPKCMDELENHQLFLREDKRCTCAKVGKAIAQTQCSAFALRDLANRPGEPYP